MLDDAFKALADPTRRLLLDRLNERNGQTLSELCAGLAMARQSVTKHLEILEAAALVTTARRGREKFHYLNAAPINEIAERWIHPYHRRHASTLAALKTALETPTMSTDTEPTQLTTFTYTTYIRTTPERLWLGLTSAEFTRQYWDIEFETDWQAGSPMTWRHHGFVIADPEQVVLESDPYRRLSYTWHTHTAELADRFGFGEDIRAGLAAEPRSTATFALEDHAPMTKLTVIHDRLVAAGTTISMISQGWPQVLSSLKTLLETGAR